MRVTQDPWCRQVQLKSQDWVHVLVRHSEMWPWQQAVLDTVPQPDAITPDPLQGRWRYWKQGLGPSTWLFAVVDWSAAEPYIVTAYGQRKGPQWKRPHRADSQSAT